MTSDTESGAALRELLPRTGADLHYATLYVAPALRRALTLVETARGLIAGTPAQCSAPEIAHAKLAWWYDETARIGTTEARHALTRALGALLPTAPALPAALQCLARGVHDLLAAGRFTDAAARYEAYDACHGPLWREHAAICGAPPDVADGAARRLGVSTELAYALRDLRRVVGSGTAFLARDREPARGNDGHAPADTDWFAAVAAIEVPVLRTELAAARTALPAPERRRLRTLWVLSALADAALQEVAADGFRVWERRVELTPLRKLWIAWRTRIAT